MASCLSTVRPSVLAFASSLATPSLATTLFTSSLLGSVLFAATTLASSPSAAGQVAGAIDSSRLAGNLPRMHSSVPPAITTSTEIAPADPEQDIRATVWLKLKDQAGFDKALADVYTEGSPRYHQWLTPADLRGFAPDRATRKTVADELGRRGLTVVEDESDPFTVKVHGRVHDVEGAFNTELHTFKTANGRAFRANTTAAHLDGQAGELVSHVSGLDTYGVRPMHKQPVVPETQKTTKAVSVSQIQAAGGVLSAFFTNKCFPAPNTFSFGLSGQLPTGTFFGNVYSTGTRSCGYTASQMQAAYSLAPVYAKKLTGKGETIVIVDAYGSSTIQADANQFNTLMGLPALTSSNFSIQYPGGKPMDPAMGGDGGLGCGDGD